MTLRFVKNDAAVPALQPGHHAYEIRDEDDRLVGIVASGESDGRTSWTAARVHPNRTLRFGSPMVHAETRSGAAELLADGAPWPRS